RSGAARCSSDIKRVTTGHTEKHRERWLDPPRPWMIWDRHAVGVRRRRVTIKDVLGYEIPGSTLFRRISTICEARAKLRVCRRRAPRHGMCDGPVCSSESSTKGGFK